MQGRTQHWGAQLQGSCEQLRVHLGVQHNPLQPLPLLELPSPAVTPTCSGEGDRSSVTDESHAQPVFVAKTIDFIFHSCQSWKAALFFSIFSEEGKTGVRACNQVLLIRTDGAGLLLQNIYSSYTLSNSASCFEINKLLLQNCAVKAEVCPSLLRLYSLA